MKRTIRLLVLVAVAIFAWYLIADRLTPYTQNARIKAIVMPIVPQVSGYVSALAAANGKIVEDGDVLAKIEDRPFRLAVDRSRAELEIASQDVGAGSAEIEVAQAKVAQATAGLENTRLQAERTFELERRGVVSAARGDTARSTLASAESNLAAAKADLARAREKLGAEGRDNPRILAAVAALGEADLNLEWTVLRAPSRGVVTDLKIDKGTFAQAGKPLMTFISMDEVWVEAYMTENNLGLTNIGDSVEVVLDIHPGRVMHGVVASFGAAAAAGRQARAGELPSTPSAAGWMRDPQRFPVRIRLPGYEAGDETDDVRLLVNGQADVIIYNSDNAVLKALGGAWIRLMSWLSYAY